MICSDDPLAPQECSVLTGEIDSCVTVWEMAPQHSPSYRRNLTGAFSRSGPTQCIIMLKLHILAGLLQQLVVQQPQLWASGGLVDSCTSQSLRCQALLCFYLSKSTQQGRPCFATRAVSKAFTAVSQALTLHIAQHNERRRGGSLGPKKVVADGAG